jgi:hypothetical protein
MLRGELIIAVCIATGLKEAEAVTVEETELDGVTERAYQMTENRAVSFANPVVFTLVSWT